MPGIKPGIQRAVACALFMATATSGCAIGPEYRERPPEVNNTWQALAGNAMPVTGEDPTLGAWWNTFNDPQLSGFIQRAVENNKTVDQAVAKVREARARRGISRADLLPSIDATSGAVRSQSDIGGGRSNAAAAADFAETNYNSGFDARWEIDLVGGRRRALQSSTAQLQASEADLRDALVTLLGDVALNYVSVRTVQSRLTFAERNLAAQQEVYNITQWRAESGLATELDVQQARASLEQTRAQIPSLETNLQQAMNRLAVLLGTQPGSLATELGERKPIPVTGADLVADLPANVLRRRPDIRSAERRLAAQTAQIGVAEAALMPNLILSGSIGVQALSASSLFSDGTDSRRGGLTVNLPIFNAGALRDNVVAQNALLDQAQANYDATVLAALEEVENALTAWGQEQRRHMALVAGADAARSASQLALMQYNSGLVDFQTVVSAERNQISLEDQLAVSDGEITSNLIRLYKAFGGGWAVFPAGSSVEPRASRALPEPPAK
jgi:NodT family efflux transporter outer membrane factor (OMF) lipoprotein